LSELLTSSSCDFSRLESFLNFGEVPSEVLRLRNFSLSKKQQEIQDINGFFEKKIVIYY
jgi:hypothetical protein